MLYTVGHVVSAGHNAEHTAQSLIAQDVGVMRFLSGQSNGGEHFLSKQLVNRQPFVPDINRVIDGHFAEHLPFSPA
ncbi:hypothetical protein PEC301877_05290 [Pectobacterium carotovorum subsp. carotovorum]|nr:hypothetical protein PEC301877_05290 [Pectobacterium carotovorum subsp. carotovorum]